MMVLRLLFLGISLLSPQIIVDKIQCPLFSFPHRRIDFSPCIILSFPTIIVESLPEFLFSFSQIVFLFPQMSSAFSQLFRFVFASSVLVAENFPSRWMTPC